MLHTYSSKKSISRKQNPNVSSFPKKKTFEKRYAVKEMAGNEVDSERIWKKQVLKHNAYLLRCAAEKCTEFTMNPYNERKNKPVTEPINSRKLRFLNKDDVAKEIAIKKLQERELQRRDDKNGLPFLGPLKAENQNKTRRNLFGSPTFDSCVHGHQRNDNGVSEFDLNALLNPKQHNQPQQAAQTKHNPSGSHLPPIKKEHINKSSFEIEEGTPQSRARQCAVQSLLNSRKVPVEKYSHPITTAHEFGWDAKLAYPVDKKFEFRLNTGEITRTAMLTRSIKRG